MTTDSKSNQACSPPTAHDEEVTLLDQIKWVVAGYPVADVAAVACLMLSECAMQQSANPDEAHRVVETLCAAMHEDVDRDFGTLKVKQALYDITHQ